MIGITVEDLCVDVGEGVRQRVIDQVNISFHAGKVHLITGPSGGGKTSLLSAIGGLLRPTSGRVLFGTDDVYRKDEPGLASYRLSSVGFLFQQARLLHYLNVIDNVALPARLAGFSGSAARQRALGLLDEMGLQALAHKRPAMLSGGEAQRVSLCRALINAPAMVLADEPIASLDNANSDDVVAILGDIAKSRNAAVLVVTHDMRIKRIADEVLWLEDGKLVGGGTDAL